MIDCLVINLIFFFFDLLCFVFIFIYFILKAFKSADAVILEPVMTVEVTGPAEFQTAIMNSMVKRKGEVTDNVTKNSKLIKKIFTDLKKFEIELILKI